MGYSVAKKIGFTLLNNRTLKENDAVMFDIDDTLLYTNGYPIEDMVSLFQYCLLLGYRVVVITARPDDSFNRRHTLTQLHLNMLFPHELHFAHPLDKSTIKEKTGLHYVLSVGDMDTDLGHSEYFIKLPDVYDSQVYSNIDVNETSFL